MLIKERQKTHLPIVIESGKPGLVTALVTDAIWVKLASMLKQKAFIAVNEEQLSISSVRFTKQKCYLNSVSAFGFSVSVVGLELSVCS